MQSISRHFARPQDGGGEEAVGLAAKRRKKRKEKCSTEQQRQFLVRRKTESACVRSTMWRLLQCGLGDNASAKLDCAMNFAPFFQAATENLPYNFQCRLACGDDARSDKSETLTQ